ncbi:MAG: type II toxin-antitoxin system PemK/MazF family toxin [Nitrososphaerota archaeon]|nr:type II toxin-antitoxin system PemK/MazF family toxin [Nitrososphaerota archaeon]MDG7039392.1 type II toxin-antitoxin system PemK/MazF family toxin [Nitrososphaerota archaeon]
MLSQRDIVLLSFPFSDLKSSKVRPAIVMSNDGYNRSSEDFIAVPITSNLKFRDYAVLITNKDLESGRLIVDSKAKVDRVFSVSQRLVRMKIGRMKVETYNRLTAILFKLLKSQ